MVTWVGRRFAEISGDGDGGGEESSQPSKRVVTTKHSSRVERRPRWPPWGTVEPKSREQRSSISNNMFWNVDAHRTSFPFGQISDQLQLAVSFLCRWQELWDAKITSVSRSGIWDSMHIISTVSIKRIFCEARRTLSYLEFEKSKTCWQTSAYVVNINTQDHCSCAGSLCFHKGYVSAKPDWNERSVSHSLSCLFWQLHFEHDHSFFSPN